MSADIYSVFRRAADPDRAAQMKAYMRNRFEFLGLPRPLRNELQKETMKIKGREPDIDWAWTDELFRQSEREFHYLAIDYLRKYPRKFRPDELPRLEQLIRRKSWWDTVDALSDAVGALVRQHPELFENMKRWITDDDFWVRRAAIIFQLKYKDDTNTDFLTEAISKNLGSGEFFINKAIGWALRQYSRTDPAWVRDFLGRHELSSLSRREAQKYI